VKVQPPAQTRKAERVPLNAIALDQGLQARVALDSDAVADYRAAIEGGAALPPVECWRVGGALYLVDGFHRVAAMAQLGSEFVSVVVVGEGTIDDAAWYAAGVNASHGLRRTNADKRRAVELALRSPIGSEQSLRVVAEHVGVSHGLVALVRREVEAPPEPAEVYTVDSETLSGGAAGGGKVEQLRRARLLDVASPRPEPGPAPRTESPAETTERLGAAIDIRGVLAHASARIRETARTLTSADDYAGASLQRARAALLDAARRLELDLPVDCPRCSGGGCPRCGGLGWVPAREVAR
jgi:hypothetical protein